MHRFPAAAKRPTARFRPGSCTDLAITKRPCVRGPVIDGESRLHQGAGCGVVGSAIGAYCPSGYRYFIKRLGTESQAMTSNGPGDPTEQAEVANTFSPCALSRGHEDGWWPTST